MGGVLTHVSIGLLGSLLIYFYFKLFDKKEFYFERDLKKIDITKGVKKAISKIFYHKIFLYSFSIFIGNIIIDFFKFFFAGLIQKRWDIFNVEFDSTFFFWANLTNNFLNWIFFGFIIFVIINYLYKKHYINRRNFFELDEIVLFFLLGVLTHLVTDIFIIEKGYWI